MSSVHIDQCLKLILVESVRGSSLYIASMRSNHEALVQNFDRSTNLWKPFGVAWMTRNEFHESLKSIVYGRFGKSCYRRTQTTKVSLKHT